MNLKQSSLSLLRKFKRLVWSILSSYLHLDFRLSSGIQLTIRSYSDWCIYGDLFANGEYDPAINDVLETNTGHSINVLDLGANNGFFALRLAHLATNANIAPSDISCLCVEASPDTFRDLSVRLSSLKSKGYRMECQNRAAGDLEGYAYVSEARSSSLNFINSKGGRWIVPFQDFNDFPSQNQQLQLLKCDIEALFLANHEPLLKRTLCCILEVHPPHYNLENAELVMRQAGLTIMGILRSTNEGTTVWFKRP